MWSRPAGLTIYEVDRTVTLSPISRYFSAAWDLADLEDLLSDT